MKKLTSKKVEEYITNRSNQELRHCPDCVAAACNDMAIKFSNEFTTPKVSGLDLMKLLFLLIGINYHLQLLFVSLYYFLCYSMCIYLAIVIFRAISFFE